MATTTIEKEILALEREFWDAMVRKDPDVPKRLTADECLLVSAPGIMTVSGKQLGEMMKSEEGNLKKYEISDVSCLEVAPNTAVIAYKVTGDADIDGKALKFKAYDATVWTKRDGRWVTTFHTEAIHGDPWGRDKKN